MNVGGFLLFGINIETFISLPQVLIVDKEQFVCKRMGLFGMAGGGSKEKAKKHCIDNLELTSRVSFLVIAYCQL